MDKNIDNLLYSRAPKSEESDSKYIDHYLEQYRIYLHVMNSTHDRNSKSNDFFLGLNTAIIGALGYLEAKGATQDSIIFLFAPFVGIAICYCWYQIISAYRQLNRAKFKVIHQVEEKLPISLFETEWEFLGKGKDKTKYLVLSKIERKIPIIFIILYIVIFLTGIHLDFISNLFK
ncbi:TPA: hypothetical protein DCX66_02690 [Candidatus Nomurabacteria bacterium]|uniref:Small integral membrane protein n=1 Tax=Candidatus Nomurabacteria bacterium GW2011_GWE1_35_16 TaxID=1618761 RepID=A0A0G0BPR3_9BACT|nr:MAG: hypothetical protein UR64_C0023G0011 [Candidatus Nomurabacteria bacterium GW2011_GWE1_35_16]HAE36913.1 hypothetical protein [Candidatus Nomurabacteria bacterium]HAX65355.1 hypothetical protein [Candidatus Nomurabacteria bacterium]HCU01180.1 hypothetical protein [Candidatus Nomurabacteria bacterium]